MNSNQPVEQKYLNLYFQVHQPRRLGKFQFFDIGSDKSYFDDELNKDILVRITQHCYLPANEMLLRLIDKYPHVRATFSISGVALEQFQRYAPEVIDSFKKLASTGAVEFLGETYYHSLSFFTDKYEFFIQAAHHQKAMIDLLGVKPAVFRNTELIYSDELGQAVSSLGYKGIYLDGIESVLKGRPVNRLYKHPKSDLVLFPRNYTLSDDIAFRYSDKNWSQWPLTPDKFINWLNQIPAGQNFTSLGMDYETFGEHQKAGEGIFQFFEEVISAVAQREGFIFTTPSEAIKLNMDKEVLPVSRLISWADREKDLSAWLGNDIQRDAFDSLNKLYSPVMNSGSSDLINDYRNLQTSDHFYYMSTKGLEDGEVHQYFSPYNSPYEAFMNYMNVLTDLELRAKNANGFKNVLASENRLKPSKAAALSLVSDF